jgi:formate--tetrahydrofolate ligase
MKPISSILSKYHISSKDTILYGEYLAKIKPILKQPGANKKLILVTAISPTPAGEGKTTVSIGLNDALNKLGKKSIVALREPSMGPVFGVKGGANGGGKAQVVPKDDIDLHLTGDFHAITAANNLISACIDNHIY